MRGILFVALGLFAGFVLGQAQPAERDIVRLNHVAIAVEDFDAGASFYTEVLGFPEAFSFQNEDGVPVLGYFQVSANTFIELLPVTPDRPPGLNHFGLEATDAGAVIEHLQSAGLKTEGPNLSSYTRCLIGRAVSPFGTPFEVLECGPESATRKAVDSWR